MATKKPAPQQQQNTATVQVKAPNFSVAEFLITGTAPYVQNKFSNKALQIMKETQSLGSQAKKGRARPPKDFDECYRGAMHRTAPPNAWAGIPAPAFRNAMISACRTVGFKMTIGKLSVFVEADGFDAEDGTPLVKITKGEPHRIDLPVRNDSGVCDIRTRPMWNPGWQARLRIRFDADQFSISDVTNLLARAGMQVGIGEGRPDSRNSAGIGWGLFSITGDKK